MPDYVPNVKEDSPRKKKLRKELYESEKEKKTLKRKLDDSIEKMNEMDLEFETLTDDYVLEKLPRLCLALIPEIT